MFGNRFNFAIGSNCEREDDAAAQVTGWASCLKETSGKPQPCVYNVCHKQIPYNGLPPQCVAFSCPLGIREAPLPQKMCLRGPYAMHRGLNWPSRVIRDPISCLSQHITWRADARR
jgi:hypothetical protein